MIYVVKRPFKSNGIFYDYGRVLSDEDAANIKLFRSKVGFGKLIAVTEQNAIEVKEYFKHKYGVDVNLETKKVPEATVTPEAPKATVTAEAPKAAKSVAKAPTKPIANKQAK